MYILGVWLLISNIDKYIYRNVQQKIITYKKHMRNNDIQKNNNIQKITTCEK